MKKNYLKMIAALGILLVLIAIIYWQKEKPRYDKGGNLVSLPKYVLKNHENLFEPNKINYVQFVKTPSDEEFFMDFYSSWSIENIHMVAIASDPDILMSVKKEGRSNVKIVDNEYSAIKKLFNLSGFTKYYLYDSSGRLILHGPIRMQYTSKIRNTMKSLLYNKIFSIMKWIPLTDLKNIEWLMQLSEIVSRKSAIHYVFILFSRLDCQADQIIAFAKNIAAAKKRAIEIKIIVNQSFAEQDVINMKAFFKIPFDIFIADNALEAEWNSMVKEYSSSTMTDIALLISSEGLILKTAAPSCNSCWADFVKVVESVMQGKKVNE